MAEAAVAYWDQYKVPPAEHMLDLVEDLCYKREKDTDGFQRIYQSMLESRDGLNSEYLLSVAGQFSKQQAIKAAVVSAAERIEAEDLVGAEEALLSATKVSISSFAPGVLLADPRQSLAFLEREQEPVVPTGVKELDALNLGPGRKELSLFIAPPKRGKSWWLVNLGKQAILARQKVLHITLEMGEEQVCQRYCQALFSISRRRAKMEYTIFSTDRLGRLKTLDVKKVGRRPALTDLKIRESLRRSLRKLTRRAALYVKQFPTGSLKVKDLEAYLDMLERSCNFIPDLILLDYADLMYLDTVNYRHDLGRLYINLRGLAVSRNIALATASQTNRAGSIARVVTDYHVGEDYSKFQTADCSISYNQTEDERALGLARLYVAGARKDEDRFAVAISQNYAYGQFCLDSVRMRPTYWDLIPEVDSEEQDEGGDDD
ncbi:hypothetical protein IMZ48_03015 [Candidatus Bathyarchaeota archaeon]|nr:hypothetical protein [Candidatus Bathyarchaeota archaeon]